jgi:hypothetical protein
MGDKKKTESGLNWTILLTHLYNYRKKFVEYSLKIHETGFPRFSINTKPKTGNDEHGRQQGQF